ncbi:hypothetical protein GGR53DRAFT_504276 [Hypoxylon sp. FL1150]|nr:hypothetical protein GGR53DRAFT_504276 [Hypoxylon sp. FL1150]
MSSDLVTPAMTEGYSSFEHKTASGYAKRRICIIEMQPTRGPLDKVPMWGRQLRTSSLSGPFWRLFPAPKKSTSHIKLFDAIGTPRCQRTIDSNRGTGEIFCGWNLDVGVDVQKLRNALPVRWGFIHIDLTTHKEEALAKLSEFKRVWTWREVA